MANVSKNELYNLICEYYEEHGNNSPVPWNRGFSVSEWASLLKVKIAPATITALVREGLLAVKEARAFDTGRTVRCYYKPHTLEERDARLAEGERQRKIEWAKWTIEGYEDRKRGAQENYQKCVADAGQQFEETLANLEQWYEEAVALLKENDEVV
jgi:hypothetical protein